MQRPSDDEIVIVISAAPIAVISNVARLTATAILYEWFSGWIDKEVAGEYIHDYAGYAMMPLAMLLLWGEMTLLRKLVIEPVPKGPLSLGGSLVAAQQNPDTASEATVEQRSS